MVSTTTRASFANHAGAFAASFNAANCVLGDSCIPLLVYGQPTPGGRAACQELRAVRGFVTVDNRFLPSAAEALMTPPNNAPTTPRLATSCPVR